MAQPAKLLKNPLNISPFWEKASTEPPLEWSKWAALFEMAVFAKDGIEVRNLPRNKPPLVERTEPIYEVEIMGETKPKRKTGKLEIKKRESGGITTSAGRTREKGVLCISFRWDEADAKVRSYIFLCLGAEGQRQIQQKRPGLDLLTVTTRNIITTLEDIFVTTKIVAFERYNIKMESLEHFNADLVELALRADCGDREDEWVRDMFTAHMHNEKIAEQLLAQSSTRNPQDAYNYSIRREKAIEHSRTLKINPFGNQTRVKQEPVHYINTRGCTNCANNQVHREVGADFAFDHIHVDNKIQEVNNNIKTQTSKLRKKVTNAVTNSDRTTYNRVPLRMKFFKICQTEALCQNMPFSPSRTRANCFHRGHGPRIYRKSFSVKTRRKHKHQPHSK